MPVLLSESITGAAGWGPAKASLSRPLFPQPRGFISAAQHEVKQRDAYMYAKILSKVLLTSAAGEFHPQEYNIHLLVGRGDPAGSCSPVTPPHCSYGN